MSTTRRWAWCCLVAMMPLLVTCTADIPTEPDVVVSLAKAGTWPDTLSIAEIATIAVTATRGDGTPIVGLDLAWQSSDTAVAKVFVPAAGVGEQLGSSLRTMIISSAPGKANILVKLAKPGFAATELSFPVVVARRVWPSLLTASDTVTGLIDVSRADPNITGGVSVEWTSSNPTIVQASRSTTDPFRVKLTGVATGAAQIVATVSSSRFPRTVFQVPITVGALQVSEPSAWRSAFTVTDTATFEVQVRDASGQRVLTGQPVQFRSTNTLALAVDINGKARALAQGSGEIVVTVGNPQFQTTEHRAAITVGGISVLELPAWPRGMTVSDTSTLGVQLRDATGQRTMTVPVQWRSTNSLVVSVDGLGRIKALSNGTADIIAAAGEVPYEVVEHRGSITVGGLQVVETTPWPTQLTVTDTVRLGAVVKDGAGTVREGATVRWTSTNPVAITVDGAGVLRALGQGSGQIVASFGDPPFQTVEHRVNVNVQPLEVIEGTPWPDNITLGGTYSMPVVVRDAQGRARSNVRVRWRTTNQSAFTVDSTTGSTSAVGLFGGELVVTVGEAPFQVSEHRRSLAVYQSWRSVDAGRAHTCALTSADATGYCWGSNDDGELGIGRIGGDASQPTRISTLARFNELEAGGIELSGVQAEFQKQSHTCGRSGNTVLCWGTTKSSQLGDGSGPCTSARCAVQTIPLATINNGIYPGASNPVFLYNVSVGGRHSCVVDLVGIDIALRCWGGVNPNSPIGDGSQGFGKTAPGVLQGLDQVRVTSGGSHVCYPFKRNSGQPIELKCFGLNPRGQLGDGSRTDILVGGLMVVDEGGAHVDGWPASAGAEHTCSVVPELTTTVLSGEVRCWGSNSAGQLGLGSLAGPSDCGGVACSLVARKVPGLTGVVAVAAGGEHTCVLNLAGAAYCWGSNADGQLGRGTFGGSSATPALVAGGLQFKSITAGQGHTCGLTADGSLYCWGRNSNGQLGTGSISDRVLVPTRVLNPSA